MNVATRAAPGCAAAPGPIVTVTPPAWEADSAGEEAGGAPLAGVLFTGAGIEGVLAAAVLAAGWPGATSASRAGGPVNGQAIAAPASAETTRTITPVTQGPPAEERHGIGPRFPWSQLPRTPSSQRLLRTARRNASPIPSYVKTGAETTKERGNSGGRYSSFPFPLPRGRRAGGALALPLAAVRR